MRIGMNRLDELAQQCAPLLALYRETSQALSGELVRRALGEIGSSVRSDRSVQIVGELYMERYA